MVTDSELAEKVKEILINSDLKKTTNNVVKTKLEGVYGVDLSHKMCFIRHQIDRYLQSHYYSSEDEQFHVTVDDAFGSYHNHGGPNDDVSDSDYGFCPPRPNLNLGSLANNSSSSNNNNNHNNTNNDKKNDGKKTDGKNSFNNGSVSFKCSSIKFHGPVKRNEENNERQNVSPKLYNLSPKLQKLLGVPSLEKTEVIKRLWSYIKEKNLQDPLDKKNIIFDETLRDIFGVETVNFLQLKKCISKHIWRSASVKLVKPVKPVKSVKSEHKGKRLKKVKEDSDGLGLQTNHERKVYSGFLAPHMLSEALMKFLGTGDIQLTRAVAIKRVWEYIKEKKLQDPRDKKTVICDDKLRELFNVDSFHGFTVSKLLTAHFTKVKT